MAKQESRDKVNYISISSEAKMRQQVPAGTTGAKERTYDTKKKNDDGTPIMGTKIEKEYESLSGKITNISFVDTEYGTLLQVEITDTFLDEEPDVLSINTSTDFAKDFMKKLPNINLEKDITVKPFAFVPEGKVNPLKGITITQDGQKIEKSFYDAEKKENIMGYPNPDPTIKDEKMELKRKTKWKNYFKDCEIFLIEYTTENFVSKFNKEMVAESLDSGDVAIPEDY